MKLNRTPERAAKIRRRFLRRWRRNRIANGYNDDGIGIIKRRLKELGYKNYSTYLASDHWTGTRERLLLERGSICELCKNRGFVQLHHRTYKNLGSELDCELIFLCDSCHHRIHQSERMGVGLERALRRVATKVGDNEFMNKRPRKKPKQPKQHRTNYVNM